MAQNKKDSPKTVTMYAPSGAKVTVSEDQAKRLNGYSKTKPSTSDGK